MGGWLMVSTDTPPCIMCGAGGASALCHPAPCCPCHRPHKGKARQPQSQGSPLRPHPQQWPKGREREGACNNLEKNYCERLKYHWHPGGFNAFCLLALNK